MRGGRRPAPHGRLRVRQGGEAGDDPHAPEGIIDDLYACAVRCATPACASWSSCAYVSLRISYEVDHFGATAKACFPKGAGSGTGANRGALGGWGGDLSTSYAEWRDHADEYAAGYPCCTDYLAKINVSSTVSFKDMLEDIDGYLVGVAVRNDVPINQVMRSHFGGGTNAGHLSRFKDYYNQRHGGSVANVSATARSVLIDVGDDDELGAIRTVAIRMIAGVATMLPGSMPDEKLNPFLDEYADTIQRFVGNENARRLPRIAKNGSEN
ncbi:hypothetical protein [Streptomyces sp. MI02-7b]|uniref:hypothetical protein n=1 Tax=Streptomyces sp. MI02-7b TaxID=462941 RepID=UPI0029A510B8|nr:hypothetical protein [Streptomyces sp. MI02-7b]MDX3076283.1 hypothetical protein [Streptomyces sp. MI02-7b]